MDQEWESAYAVGKGEPTNKIFATLEILGKKIRFQVDSGATCNIIGIQDIGQRVTIEGAKHRLRLYDGTEIKPIGRGRLNVKNPKNGKEHEKVKFVVMTLPSIPFLGAETSRRMGILNIQYEDILLMGQPAEGQLLERNGLIRENIFIVCMLMFSKTDRER